MCCRLPLNSERLEKLTENAVVDARPLLKALGIKSLPLRTLEGFKKTFDSFVMNRVLALLLLVLLSPLFVVVGLAIFLEDGAPVFFVQKRVGEGL